MRRFDTSDLPPVMRTITGPLFAAPDPFAASLADPTRDERLVGEIIARHRGRNNPVSIAGITESTGFDARKVKGIVADLVLRHKLQIGGQRQEPAGYFWVVDAADQEAAAKPFRAQVIEMWRRLRVLESRARLRELHGQLTFEEVSDEGQVEAHDAG